MQNSYRAIIEPVPDGVPRPLWSIMIPTYNCERYLRETLASVLMQDLGPDLMQIEVVDDHSTSDDPMRVVEEHGHGRVGFYRQHDNVGHIRNFETCLRRSRGRLIHLLHGDDYVWDGFYYKMQQAFEDNPEIGAAFCRHIFMDENGHWQKMSPLEQPENGILSNWLERIAVQQHIQTPSIVVRREIYEKLGGFDSRLSWTEDWEMWVRIAAHYRVWYVVEPLAVYRMHSTSNTSRHTRTGENVRDVRRAVSIIKQYLPDGCSQEVTRMSLKRQALIALNSARDFAETGQTYPAIIQIRETLRCSLSLKIGVRVFLLIVRTVLHWVRVR